MVEVSYERLATIFKALSDETRLHTSSICCLAMNYVQLIF